MKCDDELLSLSWAIISADPMRGSRIDCVKWAAVCAVTSPHSPQESKVSVNPKAPRNCKWEASSANKISVFNCNQICRHFFRLPPGQIKECRVNGMNFASVLWVLRSHAHAANRHWAPGSLVFLHFYLPKFLFSHLPPVRAQKWGLRSHRFTTIQISHFIFAKCCSVFL